MKNEQIFMLAGNAAPSVMEKTAQALAVLEGIDPWSVPDALSEMELIAETAVSGMDKTASARGLTKEALSQMTRDIGVAAVGGVLATLGTAVAMDLYDAAKRGLSKGVNFKRMMETNPNLRTMDKAKVRSAFDAVHRFGGPEYTSDPLAGGAMVKHLAELPEYSPEAVSKMVSARKSIIDSRSSQLRGDPFKPVTDVAMHSYKTRVDREEQAHKRQADHDFRMTHPNPDKS